MPFSVVCCARKIEDQDALHESFGSAGFEDIDWVTVVGAPSMGAGYNEGVRRAKYDLIVFTHTDVRLLASARVFCDAVLPAELGVTSPPCGFVGVAGTSVLTSSCIWWEHVSRAVTSGYVYQRDGGDTWVSQFGKIDERPIQALDGCFLVSTKRVLSDLGPWREDLGWHFYDIEMTYRAYKKGYLNRVALLPILHLSIGPMNEEWKASRRKIQQELFG